jgi:hypothetical protein
MEAKAPAAAPNPVVLLYQVGEVIPGFGAQWLNSKFGHSLILRRDGGSVDNRIGA